MSDSQASPQQAGSADSPPSDSPPEDGEEVWIHWKDDYWKDYHDEATPRPDTAHNTTWPGGGTNGTREGLLRANRDLAMHFVPILVVLAVLLLFTVLGNALVCLVYRTRFRRNTANLFVVFLAALEMVTMFLAVPMEMAVLALPLLFDSHVACKLVRYVETASVCVVLLTLTAIAADRYCKLTRPTNFLPLRWAKGLCIGAVLLGLCLAFPALILFGTKAVAPATGLPAPGVTGVACGVDEDMRSGPVRILYIVLLLVVFVFAVMTMAVLYVLMFVRICRRKSAARGERVSPARREYPRKHRFVTEDSTSSCGAEETRKFPTSSSGSGGSSGLGGAAGSSAAASRSGRTSPGVDPARVPLKSGVKESARIGQGASTTVDVQSTRMTWIFFIVSAVGVVSVVPFIALRTLQALTDLVESVQPLGLEILCQVCVRLYLLHPPTVPLIYLVCNHNFRREAKHLLQKVGRSCKKRPPPPATRNGR